MKNRKAKKIVLMAISYVLIAAIAVAGTLALLTDSDKDINVMALGNVEIVQNEQQRVIDENGNFGDGLEAFENDKKMLPAVYDNYSYDGTVTVNGAEYTIFDESVAGEVDKIITVSNTGSEDAYVRTLIAFEDTNDISAYIHFRSNGKIEFPTDGNGDYLQFEKDGATYTVGVYTYEEPLAAGETSAPSLMQLFWDKTATNEILAAAGDNYEVIALSQAAQVAGFDNAVDALNAGFGKITYDADEMVAGWFKATPAIVVDNVDDLFATLERGENAFAKSGVEYILETDDAINFDAKGATATMNGEGPSTGVYGYLGFVSDKVTVSNLNVTGTGFVELGDYNAQGGTNVAENIEIKNLASTLSLGDKSFKVAPAFMQFGHGTLKNCTMTGTTALTEGAQPFDLGLGQGNNRNDVDNKIEGGKYGRVYAWSQSRSTIEGAEIDYLQCAPYNGYLTIKAGTHIGTLCIDYGGYAVWGTAANLEKMIVIEEGAIVDEIVYKDSMLGLTEGPADWNGQVWNDTLYGTYTQEQWLAGAYKAQ